MEIMRAECNVHPLRHHVEFADGGPQPQAPIRKSDPMWYMHRCTEQPVVAHLVHVNVYTGITHTYINASGYDFCPLQPKMIAKSQIELEDYMKISSAVG